MIRAGKLPDQTYTDPPNNHNSGYNSAKCEFSTKIGQPLTAADRDLRDSIVALDPRSTFRGPSKNGGSVFHVRFAPIAVAAPPAKRSGDICKLAEGVIRMQQYRALHNMPTISQSTLEKYYSGVKCGAGVPHWVTNVNFNTNNSKA